MLCTLCAPCTVMQVTSTKPDGFEPKIIEKRKDYLYVEYTSPLMGVRV